MNTARAAALLTVTAIHKAGAAVVRTCMMMWDKSTQVETLSAPLCRGRCWSARREPERPSWPRQWLARLEGLFQTSF